MLRVRFFAGLVFFVFVAGLFLNVFAFAGESNNDIFFVRLKDKAEQFSIMEFGVGYGDLVDNPFDPDEINIEAHFISPKGKISVSPAFYYQNFIRKLSNGRDDLTSSGSCEWKVRFTPSETGKYYVYLTAESDGKRIKTEKRNFEVTGSDNPGFLRRSSGPNLIFDSGEIFFGIGQNVAWTYGNTYKYDSYFEKLSNNGCNFVRIWIADWNFGLEGAEKEHGGREGSYGLGRYDLSNAWKLDHVMSEADRLGLYVILVLGNYTELMNEKGFFNEKKWDQNPYNAANNGPCRKPADFWVNKNARDYYKRRLRYITARWGAHTNLLAFEWWNELNAPVSWFEEMSKYLKKNRSV